MSKKITVTPGEVRGWGNVIGEKSLSDYGTYESEVTSASESVDSRTRTVFTVSMEVTQSILSLSASPSTINLGESVTLSGSLLDTDSSPISGASVKVYMVDSSTPVTLTTGNDGSFSTTVTPDVGGEVAYYAVYDGDDPYLPGRSSNVNITVNKLTSTVTLAAVSASIVVGSTPQLTGTLKHSSTGLTGKSVRIYRGTSLVGTVTTTTGGEFSFTDDATSSTGFLEYKAVFEGDSSYLGDESSTVTITVRFVKDLGNGNYVDLAYPDIRTLKVDYTAYTVTCPTVLGYKTDNSQITVPALSELASTTIYVIYQPETVKYIVNHHFQNVENDEYDVDEPMQSEEHEGTAPERRRMLPHR